MSKIKLREGFIQETRTQDITVPTKKGEDLVFSFHHTVKRKVLLVTSKKETLTWMYWDNIPCCIRQRMQFILTHATLKAHVHDPTLNYLNNAYYSPQTEGFGELIYNNTHVPLLLDELTKAFLEENDIKEGGLTGPISFVLFRSHKPPESQDIHDDLALALKGQQHR